MILLLFSVISIIQLTLYYLKRKFIDKIPDLIIPTLMIICCFFVFPRFFYPEPRTDGINCAMPILGITLGFWFFGTISTAATHLIWVLALKKLPRKSTLDQKRKINN